MMDRLGVSPLTRNYHLFYTCIANSNPSIRKAVRNLGLFPTQRELDQVIEEHCPEAVDSYTMRRHENAVLQAIDDLALRLHSERSEMSSFQNAFERVSTLLSRSAEQDRVTLDLLVKVVGAIGEAGTRRAASSSRSLEGMARNRKEVEALRDELVQMRKMANTDALTGLANRRNFDETIAGAIGNGTEFALILTDIDHFKRINDTYGHSFGDYVLKTVTAAMGQALRAGTFIARTGGEEFAIVIAKAKEKEALAAAERVRQTVEKAKIMKGKEEVRITMSLGVVLSSAAETSIQIYDAADSALYQSKHAGRNRVTLYDPLHSDSTNRYRLYAGG